MTPKPNVRSRSWCFTYNNPPPSDFTHDPLPLWKGLKYRIHQLEVGELKTPHYQGYAYFEQAKTLSAVKKLLPTAHFKTANGDAISNEHYCSKPHEGCDCEHCIKCTPEDRLAGPWTYGECPKSSKQKGESEKARWAHMVELAKANDFDKLLEEYPREAVLHGDKFRRVRMDCIKVESTDTLDHEWVWGSTGTGKSRSAREQHPGAYIKDPQTRWWDKYAHEDVVIIDDFDKYQVAQGGDMKRWLDHYPFQAPVKGGYITIRPKKIIITSNYHPEEIWADDPKTLDPILRRVEVRELK